MFEIFSFTKTIFKSESNRDKRKKEKGHSTCNQLGRTVVSELYLICKDDGRLVYVVLIK